MKNFTFEILTNDVNVLCKLAHRYDPFTAYIENYKQMKEAERVNAKLEEEWNAIMSQYDMIASILTYANNGDKTESMVNELFIPMFASVNKEQREEVDSAKIGVAEENKEDNTMKMKNDVMTTKEMLVNAKANHCPNTPGYVTNAMMAEVLGMGKKASRTELIATLERKIAAETESMVITSAVPVASVAIPVTPAPVQTAAEVPAPKMWVKEFAVTCLYFSPAAGKSAKVWDGNKDSKGNARTVFYTGTYGYNGKTLAKAETLLAYAKHWLNQLCELRGFNKNQWATAETAAKAVWQLIGWGYLRIADPKKMSKEEKNGHTSSLEYFLNLAVEKNLIPDKDYRFVFELNVPKCSSDIKEVFDFWATQKK